MYRLTAYDDDLESRDSIDIFRSKEEAIEYGLKLDVNNYPDKHLDIEDSYTGKAIARLAQVNCVFKEIDLKDNW